MSPIAITLILLLVAIILFATEKIPVDIVGLLLVMALVLTRVLTMPDAVAGFGNDIIVTIGGLFVLVGGLTKTGLVDIIGRRMHRLAGGNIFILQARPETVWSARTQAPKAVAGASAMDYILCGMLAGKRVS